MKKLAKIIITVFSISFFVLALYITIFGTIARRNNDLLNFFGYSYAYVPTPSMTGESDDSFGENSLIVTKNISYQNIKFDDIVVYDNGNGRLIVHRVVGENDEGFIARGDANDFNDSVYVTSENFKGIVVKSYAFFDFGDNLPNIQTQILLVMIIALFIYMIVQIVKIIKIVYANKLKLAYENKYQTMKDEIKKELEDGNYEK